MIAWDPKVSYGITKERAVELGEDREYPRISAAVFHFDELSFKEKKTVISYKKIELEEALLERKKIYKDAKGANLPQGMNPFPHWKDANRRVIERLRTQVKGMETRTA